MARFRGDNSPAPTPWWVLALLLSGLCLLIRIQGLGALPIFGDEAIYLRWAQLIRPGPGGAAGGVGGHWWISLVDPKPPLHFWLIAAVFNWTRDPLIAARGISVFSGVLCVPAVMLVCAEMGFLTRPIGTIASGRAAGLLAAILLIFCPFLSFYQRLATADALFFMEMLVCVWLSLRWARQVVQGENAWPSALGLGIAMGAALLTRQGLSYTLWGMPVVAVMGHAIRNWRNFSAKLSARCFRVIGQFVVAALIAGALWSPFLVAQLRVDAKKNGGVAAELKRRILYQSDFTSGKETRWQVTERNFLATFIPRRGVNADGSPSPYPVNGWLFYYLTPGIYAASLLGLLYLAGRRQWWLVLLLVAWAILMLAPPVILGNSIFSRYVLAGAAPLLIAAAWLLADALAWLMSRELPAAIIWPMVILILAGLLIPPLMAIGTEAKDWRHQPLTRRDHYQYIDGWTAGAPTKEAITMLGVIASKTPIVVITDQADGIPADAAWVYLSRIPNVRMYYISTPTILPPAAAANTFLLRKNKYRYTPAQPVAIPPDEPVYFITNDPVLPGAGDSAEHHYRAANPNLGPGISFYGVDGPSGESHVVVYPAR